MAILSFTDLPKSFLNPFLFPGSVLLGVMNDLRLSPPGLLEIWPLESLLVVKLGRWQEALWCLLCPAGVEARPLDSAVWFLAP